MTVTVITLLKRREGMSVADFRAYYENSHRLIGEKVLAGYATRYERRFLSPTDGVDQLHDFDVITEVDFPDEATRERWFAAISDPAILADIHEDEARLFDRSRIRTFDVTVRASDLPQG